MILVERIAVEIDGEGEAVVMIHGLGGTTNMWTPLLPAFARNKRVRFDLPGSGRSSRVEGPLSIGRFVEAALQGPGRRPRSRRRTSSAIRWAPSSPRTSPPPSRRP